MTHIDAIRIELDVRIDGSPPQTVKLEPTLDDETRAVMRKLWDAEYIKWMAEARKQGGGVAGIGD